MALNYTNTKVLKSAPTKSSTDIKVKYYLIFFLGSHSQIVVDLNIQIQFGPWPVYVWKCQWYSLDKVQTQKKSISIKKTLL